MGGSWTLWGGLAHLLGWASLGKCPPCNSLVNSIPPWLGHKGTNIAKVTLLCVSWSMFPFEYVAPFPGIIISGRIGVDFWLPSIFPAETFYSSLWHFMKCCENTGFPLGRSFLRVLLLFRSSSPSPCWETEPETSCSSDAYWLQDFGFKIGFLWAFVSLTAKWE